VTHDNRQGRHRESPTPDTAPMRQRAAQDQIRQSCRRRNRHSARASDEDVAQREKGFDITGVRQRLNMLEMFDGLRRECMFRLIEFGIVVDSIRRHSYSNDASFGMDPVLDLFLKSVLHA
jgi:hypothetical protein